MTTIEKNRLSQISSLPIPRMVRWYKTKAHSVRGEFIGRVRHTKYWNGKQMAIVVFKHMKWPKRVPLLQLLPEAN